MQTEVLGKRAVPAEPRFAPGRPQGRLPTRGLPLSLDRIADLLWEFDQQEWFYRMLLKGMLFRMAKVEEP